MIRQFKEGREAMRKRREKRILEMGGVKKKETWKNQPLI